MTDDLLRVTTASPRRCKPRPSLRRTPMHVQYDPLLGPVSLERRRGSRREARPGRGPDALSSPPCGLRDVPSALRDPPRQQLPVGAYLDEQPCRADVPRVGRVFRVPAACDEPRGLSKEVRSRRDLPQAGERFVDRGPLGHAPLGVPPERRDSELITGRHAATLSAEPRDAHVRDAALRRPRQSTER